MRGEAKSISRYLRRHGASKNQEVDYLDVAGNVYSYKWLASLFSFFYIVFGCLRNGFPVVLKKMRYAGWAFWPFFFVRASTDDKTVRATINHERIHVRQQWDIHRLVSFPILLGCIVVDILGGSAPWLLLCSLPFVPTILYGLDMLRVRVTWNHAFGKPTFQAVRERTCYEMECRMHQLNDDYLKDRKFMACLSYIKSKKQ